MAWMGWDGMGWHGALTGLAPHGKCENVTKEREKERDKWTDGAKRRPRREGKGMGERGEKLQVSLAAAAAKRDMMECTREMR